MPSPEIVSQFRRDLELRERVAERELLNAYIQLRRDIEERLSTLAAKIQAAISRTIEPSETWLRQQREYRELLAQVDDEITRIANGFGATINGIQSESIRAGNAAAGELLTDAGLTVTRLLSTQDVIEAAGRLRKGAPLADLLAQLGPAAADDVGRKLMTSIVAGWSPRQLGREISNALGGNMSRAMLMARTEQVGSYRAVLLTQYRNQSRFLQGWVWHAQLDGRVCPVCLAMHGTVHPLSEEFGSHPACRCTPVPLLKGADVGFETGAEWFTGQPAEIQAGLLGPAAHRAWLSGAVDLSDFVKRYTDPIWGLQRRRRSLAEILGELANDYYRRAA